MKSTKGFHEHRERSKRFVVFFFFFSFRAHKLFFEGLRDDEDIQEYFDTPSTIKANVARLAVALREGTCIVFSGAGISTSSGLPDYRGPKGVWTLREKGIEPDFPVTLENAKPTTGHVVVSSLVKEGLVRAVVTTNIDGLHQKAGVAEEKIAELHGNCFKTCCKDCKTIAVHDYDVLKPKANDDHVTGRKCDKCGGALLDNIVHFGEPLASNDFARAGTWAKSSDYALVLGTSLRVRPANTLPQMVSKEVFVVNLQKTPLDAKACVTYVFFLFFFFFFFFFLFLSCFGCCCMNIFF